MQRTTIMAEEHLLEQLRQVAAERRVSLAALIREALEEKVRVTQPKPHSGGIGESGAGDLGRRSGDERPEPREWR